MGNMLKTIEFIDDFEMGRAFYRHTLSHGVNKTAKASKKLAACHELPRRITI